MLDPSNGRNVYASTASAGPPPVETSVAETIEAVFGIIRRNYVIFCALGFIGAVLGIVVFLNSKPLFTATATLLINTHKMELFQQPAVSDELPLQAAGAVESQAELIRSDAVALRVIKKLDLTANEDFMGNQKPGFVKRFLRDHTPRLFLSKTPNEIDRENQAVYLLRKNLSVERIGVAYAIAIKFNAGDAALAAAVANAVADAYVEVQRSSEYETARRASDWLEQRLPELRAKSEAAQNAVVAYKQEHNIVEATGGQLLEEQRLADINLKINASRDDTLRAKARLEQFERLTASGARNTLPGGSRGESAGSDALEQLRSEYFSLSSKMAEVSGKFGANNPAVVSLRNQEAQLRSEIDEEINRLKQASESDYSAAQLHELALKKEFEAAVSEARAAKEAGVKLHELEAAAHAYQDLYASYLTRYNASLHQEASPVAEATIISPATPLLQRDYKKTILTAAIFPIGGLILGIALTLLREILADRGFLTSKSILARLDIPCIDILPFMRATRKAGKFRDAWLGHPDLLVGRNARRQYYAFGQGIRSIRFAIDLECRSSTKVVGITSTLATEGRSTVALAVARLIASSGSSVILVDCDLRDPSLSHAIAPTASKGFVDLALGKADFADVVRKDQMTGMDFLPTGYCSAVSRAESVLSTDETKALFEALRASYQYVIVDVPPLVLSVDSSATAAFVDAFVLVVEWKHTRADIVKRALRAAPPVSSSVIGAVLNKCDMNLLSTYDPYVTKYVLEPGGAQVLNASETQTNRLRSS